MDTTPDTFDVALATALAKLVPGKQTDDAAELLLEQYRYKVRTICTSTAELKVRMVRLEAADAALLTALDDLADTEHDEPHVTEPAAVTKGAKRKPKPHA